MKYVILVAFSLSSIVMANQRIDKGLEQLKTNYDNSSYNRKEYSKNFKTVKNNISEIDKVIINLKKQKKDIRVHLKNSKKNKVNLKKQRKTLQTYIDKENLKIRQEQKRIDKLKAKIQQLEDNQEQRRVNIAAYNEKVYEIDDELKDWENQKQRIAELEQIILDKEQEAKSERKSWQAKEKTYASQVNKWGKQEQKHRDIYKKYDRLNN